MEYDESSGRTIHPPNPWTEVIAARTRQALRKARAENRTTPNNNSAAKPHVPARAIPPPRLPDSHYITVYRPRTGLRVGAWATRDIVQGLITSSGLPRAQFLERVIIQAQPTQNLVVAGTPDPDIATVLSQITMITLGQTSFEITAYMKPPPGTSRGVIHGLPEDIDNDALLELTAANKPYLIHARLLGRTSSALLTFNGTRVPFYVKVGCELIRCRPYRRVAQVCQQCGEVGHRRDVCPQPESTNCFKCGAASPSPDHTCLPNCKLCDQPHPTASKECPKRHLPTPPPQRARKQQPAQFQARLQQQQRHQAPPAGVPDPPLPTAQVSWSAAVRGTPTAPSQPLQLNDVPQQHPLSPYITAFLNKFSEQQKEFQARLDALTEKVNKLTSSPLPPLPPLEPEQLDERFNNLLDTITKALSEATAPLHDAVNALTTRQLKLEKAISALSPATTQSLASSRKAKYHPYDDGSLPPRPPSSLS